MEANTLTQENIESVVRDIVYKDWAVRIKPLGDGYFIQIIFIANDCKTGLPEQQKGRKWYVSPYSTKSEVVQTVFAAIGMVEEHERRENFFYKGEAIFGPHFSCEDLKDFAKDAKEDARQHLYL